MTRRALVGILSFCLLSSVFLINCESYVLCLRYYNAIEKKRGTCSGTIKDGNQKVDSCKKNLEKCTEDDRKIVDEAVTCMEKMDVCKGGLEAISWATEYASCNARVLTVSPNCRHAFTSR